MVLFLTVTLFASKILIPLQLEAGFGTPPIVKPFRSMVTLLALAKIAFPLETMMLPVRK